MPRYNIALIPTLLKDREYIQKFSQEKFSSITSGYLLGPESLPHISICQFECTDNEFVKIYPQIMTMLRDTTQPFYNLDINGFNVMRLGGQFEGQQAAEFNIARTSNLMSLHHSIIEAIKKLRLNPLNAAGDQYRPHLTLAFFEPGKARAYSMPIILPNELDHISSFMVSLGAADLNWQFNRIIDFPKEKLETVPLEKAPTNTALAMFNYSTLKCPAMDRPKLKERQSEVSSSTSDNDLNAQVALAVFSLVILFMARKQIANCLSALKRVLNPFHSEKHNVKLDDPTHKIKKTSLIRH